MVSRPLDEMAAMGQEKGGDMTIYPVKPYREAGSHRQARPQSWTAFCALFGLARWHIPARRCRLPDNCVISAATIQARIAELGGGAVKDD